MRFEAEIGQSVDRVDGLCEQIGIQEVTDKISDKRMWRS